MELTDLLKFIKSCVAEAEKKAKHLPTAAKGGAKKTGSMPKGAVPPQLKKPRAWVEYTLKHALENGWESFTIHQSHKDKESGEKVEEEIEMPASVLHNGAYVYEDSVDEAHPDGRQIIHKEAMSLSKQRKEANHPTYAEFEAQYVPEASEDEKSVATSTASSKKSVVKKTAAEKEAEKAAKKAEKEAAASAKKAEKEEEKERKKAEKEAEKAAAKAAKEVEKEAKKAEKKPATKSVVPAKAIAKPAAPAATPAKKAVTAEEKPAPAAPKKKPAPAKPADDIPDDGMVHPWTYNGKKYLRNAQGETWTVGADGGMGAWAGLYSAATDKLDTKAAEPTFDDEDE
jgi:DNA polymerase III gamma/tau subunit